MVASVTESLRLLLTSSIDYAGLFPPADLDLAQAAENYVEYKTGPHAWMLGSFVVPAARLEELERFVPEATRPWPVSALVGPNLRDEIVAAEQFTVRGAGKVEWLEAKVSSAEQLRAVRQRVPRRFGIYFEVPAREDGLLKVVRETGARGKIRTGGLTADAIPPADVLARFLIAASTEQVAFKATAGLHHPMRCERPLTYRQDGPDGTMHGFLNVLLAAIFARGGLAVDEVCEILEERSVSAFGFDADGITWRYHRITNKEIRDARQTGIVSFGSCSFKEPVEELASIGLL